MKIDITGRHIEVTPALREFTEDKLAKLERLLVGPIEAHVVLGISKHRHTAEVKITSKSAVLSGTMETGDLYASIGEVSDKLERQALKHKEKIRDHKDRRSLRDPEVTAAIEAEAAEPPGAPAAPSDSAPRLVRSRRFRLKPMSAEDALMELESMEEDVLVFRDSESSRINVLYREKDGGFALIDPEF